MLRDRCEELDITFHEETQLLLDALDDAVFVDPPDVDAQDEIERYTLLLGEIQERIASLVLVDESHC
jgi:hypothetical protein